MAQFCSLCNFNNFLRYLHILHIHNHNNDKLLFSDGDSIPKLDSDKNPDGKYSQQVIKNSGLTQESEEKEGLLGFLGFVDIPEAKEEKPASTFNLGTGKVKAAGDKLYSVGVSNQLQVPYSGKGVDIDNPNNGENVGAFVEGLITGENELGVKIDRKDQEEIKDILWQGLNKLPNEQLTQLNQKLPENLE